MNSKDKRLIEDFLPVNSLGKAASSGPRAEEAHINATFVACKAVSGSMPCFCLRRSRSSVPVYPGEWA